MLLWCSNEYTQDTYPGNSSGGWWGSHDGRLSWERGGRDSSSGGGRFGLVPFLTHRLAHWNWKRLCLTCVIHQSNNFSTLLFHKNNFSAYYFYLKITAARRPANLIRKKCTGTVHYEMTAKKHQKVLSNFILPKNIIICKTTKACSVWTLKIKNSCRETVLM